MRTSRNSTELRLIPGGNASPSGSQDFFLGISAESAADFAARSAGHHRMHREGRRRWNRGDYIAACEAYCASLARHQQVPA